MKKIFTCSSVSVKVINYTLQDYRLEDNKYNKIVSVGMFEHVGKPFYATYFKKIHDLYSICKGLFIKY